MKLFWLCFVALPAWPQAFDHSAWDAILKESVNEIGEVDYARLKANPGPLAAYVAKLAAARTETWPSREEQLAFWINAYNALTTYGVARQYPVASVKDLGFLFGFFRRDDYTAGGRKLSLMTLENGILRARFAEPRIHFAIVCASLSCPKLARTAFTAANLNALLESQTRQYFAERRNLSIDAKANRVTLAAILDWYKADFEKFTGQSAPLALLDYARRYAGAEQREALAALKSPKIGFRDYDWSINDPGSRRRAKSAEERELAKP
ncbi:MAG: DUF547 domain-containing protein [Bryobacteraceae bacterium]|nr:DUF547 domain-containing protein [Bryobacteraceae bacterium]